MKSDQITAQQAFKNLLTPGQDCKNIVAGEGGVMEECNLQVGSFFANVSRCKPKVVVVNPYSRFFGCFSAGCFGKTTVDLFKDAPISIIDIEVGGECMKDWPKGLLRSDVIKA